jgi:hypothetical protein
LKTIWEETIVSLKGLKYYYIVRRLVLSLFAVALHFSICSSDPQLSDGLFFSAVALQLSAFDDPQGCGSMCRGADKFLARPTSRCIFFFVGENISFDASLVVHINSTNIPPVMIINRIYENQNLLSL